MVNNDLCRKLTALFALPIIFGDIRTVISDSFLLLILIYHVVNLIALSLHFGTGLLYTCIT